MVCAQSRLPRRSVYICGDFTLELACGMAENPLIKSCAWLSSVPAETQLSLVWLEVSIKIFCFKFYRLHGKGQINLPSGKKEQKNYCYPLDIPILCCILYTFTRKELRQLSEYTQQGKMLSCSFYYLSQYLCCSSIAFLLYWKIPSLVRAQIAKATLLIFYTNSIILPDISWKRSLILRRTFRIGTETVFWQLCEINTSSWQSVLLLAVCNSQFLSLPLTSFAGEEIRLYMAVRFECHGLSYCLLKKIIVRSRSDLKEAFWTEPISRGEARTVKTFGFLIPKETLVRLAARSTGSRNKTPLARPLVSIIMGGICIYIVNAQTFFTSWSMKSPFRWRRKYTPSFSRDVAVLSKASVTQRNV